MLHSGLHYFPLTWPFLTALAVLLGLLLGMVAARVLRYASESMGLGPMSMFAVLLLSLVLSYVNIPIAVLPERETASSAVVSYFGVRYVVPVISDWPATVLAVNMGGAVVPVVLSLYLLVKNRLFVRGLAGIAIVTLICYALADPVHGIGIAEPMFVPPLATAAVALILSRRRAGPLAYVSGSLGTLIGADLLNLGKIQGLGAPIASIGGAGTFDGVFLTGLLAVVYASVFSRRPEEVKP